MKLYFVRHGKTVWNLERRFQGMTGDSPLLEESHAEIKALGDYLSNVEFKQVLSSPSKRAYDTAKGIVEVNALPKEIEKDERLYEWNLGSLEGREIEKVGQEYPDALHAFRNNPEAFQGQIFDAENVDDVIARISHLVRELAEDENLAEDDNVLLVGHGAALTSSLQSLLGVPKSRLRKDGILSNSSLTILDVKNLDQIELIEWNKTV
ncbi:histidine phosphatase family protein [Streptococcaceae bacterium ESL0687]|nr:histidine phosphatase family protein [Streptococcaceae bacterium ESL0687]